MKVLVVSDSHGCKNTLEDIVEDNLDARYIIHLGDGERDMDNVPALNQNAKIIMVRGNCDLGSSLPLQTIKCIEGHTIFCTHGFQQGVKRGTHELLKSASSVLADIVLYGHTHIPVNKEVNGIHVFNPGSANSSVYGIIDFNGENVTFEHKMITK